MFKMWTISRICGLFFLIGCAAVDIKEKRIPVHMLVLGSGGVIIFRIIYAQHMFLWITGGLIGVLFFFVSKITKEAFGYGDSWIILILGIYLGLWDVMSLLSIAFFTSALYGIYFFFRRRYSVKSSFPFAPFLTIAYVGVTVL